MLLKQQLAVAASRLKLRTTWRAPPERNVALSPSGAEAIERATRGRLFGGAAKFRAGRRY